MQVSVVSPFPRDRYEDAYLWHKSTSTIINGRDYSLRDFLELMAAVGDRPGARSWGVCKGEDLVGIVIFEPCYHGRRLTDGSLHIALARRVWGRYVMDRIGPLVLADLFTSTPSLQRVSASIISTYTPSTRVVKALGFTQEGCLRDAVFVGGVKRDLSIWGLTREDWNGKLIRRTNNNNQ